MVLTDGLEPSLLVPQTSVLPLSLNQDYFWYRAGIQTLSASVTVRNANSITPVTACDLFIWNLYHSKENVNRFFC